jgi:hypothetical protein
MEDHCGDVMILSALYVPASFIKAISFESTYLRSRAAGELIYKTGYFLLLINYFWISLPKNN